MQLVIREESPADHDPVFEIEREAFDSEVQPRLVERLRETASPSLSLVAWAGAEPVGHIFFSPVTLAAAPDRGAAQLSPVAVRRDHQGQGAGSALIREGLARCPALGWSSVFLVGNPLYYRRFEFEMAGPRGFSCGGPHDPALQLIELEAGALTGAEGHVAFHPAFAEIDGE